ncbi:MAG: ATP-binding cassette domain-containing protein [Bacteroidetes bacterium]|nr:ATP-binding cassette domain-containing protein [Bacteroidota bacterium]HET6245601.1 ATP-binding cassette domain-containing protein [Bacteroidia bacterium]
MIEVKNLIKSFNGTPVLKNINIQFIKGNVNVIIGQSGSGKTVLLKCLVGLHDVDQGNVLFEGSDFLNMPLNEKKEIRKELGMLFQGGALFDYMTVEENVKFPLSMFTTMTIAEQQDRADFCLERVNLINSKKLFPAELSGGMQKRVAIARAISMNPKYLFCDEPNSGLDPTTAIIIDNLIAELTQEYNMTTIVITHDMNSVIEIGDYINFLYKGEIWWKGNKEDILHTDNLEINDFVYASKFMKKLKEGGRI